MRLALTCRTGGIHHDPPSLLGNRKALWTAQRKCAVTHVSYEGHASHWSRAVFVLHERHKTMTTRKTTPEKPPNAKELSVAGKGTHDPRDLTPKHAQSLSGRVLSEGNKRKRHS